MTFASTVGLLFSVLLNVRQAEGEVSKEHGSHGIAPGPDER